MWGVLPDPVCLPSASLGRGVPLCLVASTATDFYSLPQLNEAPAAACVLLHSPLPSLSLTPPSSLPAIIAPEHTPLLPYELLHHPPLPPFVRTPFLFVQLNKTQLVVVLLNSVHYFVTYIAANSQREGEEWWGYKVGGCFLTQCVCLVLRWEGEYISALWLPLPQTSTVCLNQAPTLACVLLPHTTPPTPLSTNLMCPLMMSLIVTSSKVSCETHHHLLKSQS